MVKMKEANEEKKKSWKANPLPHGGDFRKMAEMMKNHCSDEGSAACCCSMMRRMMDHGKGAEAKESKETQKAPNGGENAENSNPHVYLPIRTKGGESICFHAQGLAMVLGGYSSLS